MKRITAAVSIVFILVAALSAGAWKLARNEAGIKIYTQNVEGQALDKFKAVGVVNAPLALIVEVLKDVNNYHHWYGDCKSQRKIKRYSPLETLVYHVQKVPVISNRDVVVRGKITVNYKKGTATQVMRAVTSTYAKDSGNVRMPFMQGSFALKQLTPNSTRVTYTMLANPGGSVPSWLSSGTAKKQPFKTLMGLRKVVKNQKYAALAKKAAK